METNLSSKQYCAQLLCGCLVVAGVFPAGIIWLLLDGLVDMVFCEVSRVLAITTATQLLRVIYYGNSGMVAREYCGVLCVCSSHRSITSSRVGLMFSELRRVTRRENLTSAPWTEEESKAMNGIDSFQMARGSKGITYIAWMFTL